MQYNKRLAIIGAGSLGVMTLDAVLNEGNYAKNEIVFIDNGKEKNELIYGVPVIGGMEIIKSNHLDEYDFIIAIANNKVRKEIAENNDLPYATVIHPHASVSKYATIGIGNIILPNVTIDPDAIIHNHVIINKNTSVGHNVEMEDFSQASPGCLLGGLIQQGTFLGIGVTLLPNIKIGRFSIVGAGAVVIKDLPDYCTAIGTPAKVTKYNKGN